MNFSIMFAIIYALLNLACAFALIIVCFSEIDLSGVGDLFIYPRLVDALRERLNLTGTILVTGLFSVFFAPAIILYFLTLSLVALGYLIWKLFLAVFGRRD